MTSRTDLAAALDDVLTFVRRYLVMRDDQAVALALWVAHTFVFDRGDQSPILGVTSAVSRSGKSRLFEVLRAVVARPWYVIRPSEAVVFRRIARDHPTLLLDEGDALWNDRSPAAEGLRAILNAGNRRDDAVVSRVVSKGRTFDLADFDIYCPKAVAGIGGLPATVLDRAIVLRMVRRRPDEPVDKLRLRLVKDDGGRLRERLAAATQSLGPLEVPRDRMPPGLTDREEDGWEPLVAIADAAGGDWAERVRAAAVLLQADAAQAAEDDAGLALLLLRDLREIFAAADVEGIPTAVLVHRLVAMTDSPWAAMPPAHRPATGHDLRRMLAPYGIRPDRLSRTIDPGHNRGYLRAAFVDAWGRYLPSRTPGQVDQVDQVSQPGPSERAGGAESGTPGTPGTPATHNGATGDADLAWAFVTLDAGDPGAEGLYPAHRLADMLGRPVEDVSRALRAGAGRLYQAHPGRGPGEVDRWSLLAGVAAS
jgi:hypothetical protein